MKMFKNNKKENNLEEVIKAATEWWVQVIKSPKFDNGDHSDQGAMLMMLATMANDNVITPEIELLFRTELEKVIRKQLINCNSVVLSVDYGPDYYLSQAATKAGLNNIGFPWKTTMWITKENVSVSYGYGAEIKTIYDKNQRYSDQDDTLEKGNINNY